MKHIIVHRFPLPNRIIDESEVCQNINVHDTIVNAYIYSQADTIASEASDSMTDVDLISNSVDIELTDIEPSNVDTDSSDMNTDSPLFLDLQKLTNITKNDNAI